MVKTYKEILGDKFDYQEIPPSRISANMFFGVLSDRRKYHIGKLKQAGIPYKICWPYINKQPFHKKFFNSPLPNTESISKRILALPLGNNMDIADVERVCKVLK